MSPHPALVFKFASEDWELEQIHRLNYKTFVQEIPQHQASPSHRLVDRFHAENIYLICLHGAKLAGMLAVRGTRPFSLDQKLPNLDSYLPPALKPCEIRLLAIEKRFRGAQVLQGILALLWQHGVEKGYDLAVISGTTRQFKLYHHLGFVPFGPLVGSGDARFQPMYVTLETFEHTAREFLRSSPSRSFQASALSFLPGPVTVPREVRRAFEQTAESHRSEAFVRDFRATRQALCELTLAGRVDLLMGSGTLANDAVAAQLSTEVGRGLVLTNGEFGERLIDHAMRFNLNFDAFQFSWGEPLDLAAAREWLRQNPAQGAGNRPLGRWLWCAHCETSTGVLNNLGALKALCAEFQANLCLDAVSSLGTVPLDLRGVYLAAAASGKGLRSYPGISMVFHHHEIPPAPELPRYLDLGSYGAGEGAPFTFSSNLLHALHTAVQCGRWDQRFAELKDRCAWLRARLVELGFELVGRGAVTSPAVVTIALPEPLPSVKVGDLMQEAGYLLSCNSDYLRRRNWIQISLMGECAKERLVSLLNTLNRVCFRSRSPSATPPSKPRARAGQDLPTRTSPAPVPRPRRPGTAG